MRNWKAQLDHLKQMPTSELLSASVEIFLIFGCVIKHFPKRLHISSTSFWWTIHNKINGSAAQTQAKAGFLLTTTVTLRMKWLFIAFVRFVWHQCLFSHLTHTNNVHERQERVHLGDPQPTGSIFRSRYSVGADVCLPVAIPHQIAQTITLIERCLSPTRAINLYRAWETEYNAVVTAKPPLQGHTYKQMQVKEGEWIESYWCY